MAWVRLDDSFTEHPKVMAAGPLALAMQVAGLCYCNRNLTDGFIPWGIARTLLSWEVLGPDRRQYRISVTCGAHGEDVDSEYVIKQLVDAGMWEEVDGGYRVHDYLQYQPSRAKVMAERAAAQERMARKRKEARSEDVRANNRRTSAELQEKFKDPDPDPDPINKDHMSSPAPPSRTSASDEEYSKAFETWWADYPRKVRKREAYSCWKARLREGVTAETLTRARDAYVAYCNRKGTPIDYIMHAATYLGKKRPFEDYLEAEPEGRDKPCLPTLSEQTKDWI